MLATVVFAIDALRKGHAYIDVDGCILQAFPVPLEVPKPDRLSWWLFNLSPTPVIKRRLPLLYLLHACGCKLHLWINRSERHWNLTFMALGKHGKLFVGSTNFFMGGSKTDVPRWGPCMDDDPRYACGPTDLRVKGIAALRTASSLLPRDDNLFV